MRLIVLAENIYYHLILPLDCRYLVAEEQVRNFVAQVCILIDHWVGGGIDGATELYWSQKIHLVKGERSFVVAVRAGDYDAKAF